MPLPLSQKAVRRMAHHIPQRFSLASRLTI